MIRPTKFKRWLLNDSEPTHRAIAAWVYIVGIAVVSSAFHGPTWMHDLVRDCCAFQGNEIDGPGIFKMIGGAFLVPDGGNFFWGLIPLALSLPALERRIGTKAFVTIAAAGHIGATLIVDGLASVTGHEDALTNVDVGSSVVMLSCVAALAIVTKSWKVWAILLVGLAIDAITKHDQATAEHCFGLIIGVAITTIRQRRHSSCGNH